MVFPVCMVVHLSRGELVYSTDMASWGADNLKAFSRVVDNLSATSDLRFCAFNEGAVCFVYIRTVEIAFLEFSEREYLLMEEALEKTAVKVPPSTSDRSR